MTDPATGLDPESLRGLSEEALDERLRAFANARGADALPALSRLAESASERGVRRAAKRALYRLSQRGVAAAPAPPPAPVVQRRAPRAVRAWLSGIDGSGSRAVWILFEGPYGGGLLCSLILNDIVGITEVAGGDITKRRLDAELASLRAAQKLPWVETDPARAVGLVAESLQIHRERGTSPPSAFGRWQPFFTEVAGGDITKRRLEAELASLRAAQKLPWVQTEPARAVGLVAESLQIHRERGTSPPSAFGRWQPFFTGVAAPEPPPAPVADADRLARSDELLGLPELGGWFLDPETVQSDALEIQETRQSRLVVSDQIKAERQEAILTRVIEREFAPEARRRWARRLAEMAWIFSATDRPEQAANASAAAAAFAESDAAPLRHPLARALAQRALELAGEVSAGRLRAADVSRKP